MGKSKFNFNHIGVAVSNLKKALPLYQNLFGYKLIDNLYEDPIQKVNVCFLSSGKGREIVIELVEPSGEDTPVSQWLARGIGAYHVCYDIEDMNKTLEDVLANRCIIVNKPVPAVAFAGRRVAWFYTPTRQLIEIVEK